MSSALPIEDLKEAHRLHLAEQYREAESLYTSILRANRDAMKMHVMSFANLNLHKEMLKTHLCLQILSQPGHANGFQVNLGDYCFPEGPSPDIFISGKAIHALDRFKGGASSMVALRTDGIFKTLSDQDATTALLYYAHSVSGDVIDMCLFSGPRPIGRIAELGAGAGMQSVTFAKLRPSVQMVTIIEIEDYLCEGVADLFAANGMAHYRLNAPFESEIDWFYSFRACAYYFSVDIYYDRIKAACGPQSWGLFDVGGGRVNREHERAQMRKLFAAEVRVYEFGRTPSDYWRTIFSQPKT